MSPLLHPLACRPLLRRDPRSPEGKLAEICLMRRPDLDLPGTVPERTAQPVAEGKASTPLGSAPSYLPEASLAAGGSRSPDVKHASTLPSTTLKVSREMTNLSNLGFETKKRLHRAATIPINFKLIAENLLVKSWLGRKEHISQEKKELIAKKVFDRWEELPADTQAQLLLDLFPASRSVFLPTQPAAKRWDSIMSLVMLYVVVVTPFDVAFLSQSVGPVFFLNRITDLFFTVDICLSFFRSYSVGQRHRGIKPQWEVNPEKVAWHYFCHGFAIDLMALLSSLFEIIGLFADIQSAFMLIRVVRLIRLTRLMKLGVVFERFRDQLALSYWAGEFLRGSLFLLVVAHMMACLYGYTALTQQDLGMRSWLDVALQAKGITVGDSPWTLYFLALYWAFMTLTSIGYGDIAPYTLAEVLITTCLMLVGAAVWTYFVSVSISAVSAMDESRNMCGATIGELKELSNDFAFPAEFQARARQFVLNSREHSSLKDFPNIVNSVSSTLRWEIFLHVKRTMMKRAPYLAKIEECGHGSKALVYDIADLMEQHRFNANEWVVPPGLDRYVESMKVEHASMNTFTNLARFCYACDLKPDAESMQKLFTRGSLPARYPPPITFLEAGVVMRRYKLVHGCWHKDAVVSLPELRDLEVARSVSFSSAFFLDSQKLISVLENGNYVQILTAARKTAAYCGLMQATLLAAKYAHRDGGKPRSYTKAIEGVIERFRKRSGREDHIHRQPVASAVGGADSTQLMSEMLDKLRSIDRRLSQHDSSFEDINGKLRALDQQLKLAVVPGPTPAPESESTELV